MSKGGKKRTLGEELRRFLLSQNRGWRWSLHAFHSPCESHFRLRHRLSLAIFPNKIYPNPPRADTPEVQRRVAEALRRREALDRL